LTGEALEGSILTATPGKLHAMSGYEHMLVGAKALVSPHPTTLADTTGISLNIEIIHLT